MRLPRAFWAATFGSLFKRAHGRVNENTKYSTGSFDGSVALWRIWQIDAPVKPDYLAGHSLGEHSALVCAGESILKSKETVRKRAS